MLSTNAVCGRLSSAVWENLPKLGFFPHTPQRRSSGKLHKRNCLSDFHHFVLILSFYLLLLPLNASGRVVPSSAPIVLDGATLEALPKHAADSSSNDDGKSANVDDKFLPPLGDEHVMAYTALPVEVSTDTWLGSGFFHAVIASFSIIIFTELGDKTFFIAAIMSMQHSRLRVFAGAISALILMTVLSSLLGFAATVIPHAVTHYAAAALFFIFGLKMLYDAWKMKPEESQEEYNETVVELRERQIELQRTFGSPTNSNGVAAVSTTEPPSYDEANGTSSLSPLSSTSCAEPRLTLQPNATSESPAGALPWKLRILRHCTQLCSIVFLEALTLTFLAEWGDRSQISTIVLAARGENFWGVNLGACVGHSMCTGLACIGGSLIAKKISPRQVMLAGGILFLAFAVYGAVAGP